MTTERKSALVICSHGSLPGNPIMCWDCLEKRISDAVERCAEIAKREAKIWEELRKEYKAANSDLRFEAMQNRELCNQIASKILQSRQG